MNNIEESNFSYIKNIFESISNEYDFMNDLMTFNNHSKWKKEIVEIAIDSSPKKILDIATGTGDIAIKLSKIILILPITIFFNKRCIFSICFKDKNHITMENNFYWKL